MIKVIRSFSRKIQIKQYEPIDVFCSAEQEGELGEDMTAISELLDEFCRYEVEKTISGIINAKADVLDKKQIGVSSELNDAALHALNLELTGMVDNPKRISKKIN